MTEVKLDVRATDGSDVLRFRVLKINVSTVLIRHLKQIGKGGKCSVLDELTLSSLKSSGMVF